MGELDVINTIFQLPKSNIICVKKFRFNLLCYCNTLTELHLIMDNVSTWWKHIIRYLIQWTKVNWVNSTEIRHVQITWLVCIQIIWFNSVEPLSMIESCTGKNLFFFSVASNLNYTSILLKLYTWHKPLVTTEKDKFKV